MYILGPIMFVVSTTFFFIPFSLRFYAKTKNYVGDYQHQSILQGYSKSYLLSID